MAGVRNFISQTVSSFFGSGSPPLHSSVPSQPATPASTPTPKATENTPFLTPTGGDDGYGSTATTSDSASDTLLPKPIGAEAQPEPDDDEYDRGDEDEVKDNGILCVFDDKDSVDIAEPSERQESGILEVEAKSSDLSAFKNIIDTRPHTYNPPVSITDEKGEVKPQSTVDTFMVKYVEEPFAVVGFFDGTDLKAEQKYLEETKGVPKPAPASEFTFRDDPFTYKFHCGEDFYHRTQAPVLYRSRFDKNPDETLPLWDPTKDETYNHFRTVNTLKNVAWMGTSILVSVPFALNAGAGTAALAGATWDLSTLSWATIASASAGQQFLGATGFATSLGVNAGVNFALLPKSLPAAWEKIKRKEFGTLLPAALQGAAGSVIGYQSTSIQGFNAFIGASFGTVLFGTRLYGTELGHKDISDWNKKYEGWGAKLNSLLDWNLVLSVPLSASMASIYTTKLNTLLNAISGDYYSKFVPLWARNPLNLLACYPTPMLFCITLKTAYPTAKKTYHAIAAKVAQEPTRWGKTKIIGPAGFNLVCNLSSGLSGYNLINGCIGKDGFILGDTIKSGSVAARIISAGPAAAVSLLNTTVTAKNYYKPETQLASSTGFFREAPRGPAIDVGYDAGAEAKYGPIGGAAAGGGTEQSLTPVVADYDDRVPTARRSHI